MEISCSWTFISTHKMAVRDYAPLGLYRCTDFTAHFILGQVESLECYFRNSFFLVPMLLLSLGKRKKAIKENRLLWIEVREVKTWKEHYSYSWNKERKKNLEKFQIKDFSWTHWTTAVMGKRKWILKGGRCVWGETELQRLLPRAGHCRTPHNTLGDSTRRVLQTAKG